MLLTTYKISVKKMCFLLIFAFYQLRPKLAYFNSFVRTSRFLDFNIICIMFKLFECLHLLRCACVIMKTMIDVFTV